MLFDIDIGKPVTTQPYLREFDMWISIIGLNKKYQ